MVNSPKVKLILIDYTDYKPPLTRQESDKLDKVIADLKKWMSARLEKSIFETPVSDDKEIEAPEFVYSKEEAEKLCERLRELWLPIEWVDKPPFVSDDKEVKENSDGAQEGKNTGIRVLKGRSEGPIRTVK